MKGLVTPNDLQMASELIMKQLIRTSFTKP
ncbi:hypothetical protein SAMN05216593_102123 [Pseudomonas asturiensis]|uniref:Uncharacterized protein n=1 Tax=Pseudomonas asturiensis TaxID=1190415 RepID=A0A1M7KH38_9PSED|nr:hypothetical protein SAMN05216593_102123 [Pseudomonas asturiensis]